MILVAPGGWELFGDAVATGVLLAAALPWFGVVLVLRQQLFLAAAIGQGANLGIAVALWAGLGGAAVGAAHDESVALGAGVCAGAATAIAAMRALSRRGSSLEARAAWMFLCGGSGAMLLLADAPHGLQEVQRLQLSSLLGASASDVWVSAGLVSIAAAALWRWRRLLLAWAMDPATVQAHGGSVLRLDVLVGGAIGGAIGFSIHATGLPFTFGVAVLPVLLLRELAGSLAAVLGWAPVVGAGGFLAAFWLADRADLPPGQATVVLLGAAVVAARGGRTLAAKFRRGAAEFSGPR